MDTWDLMQNWRYVLPPSRPSAEQLAELVNISRGIDRNAPVAILGSTPEFRDLLFEAGFRSIHVLDKNEMFYEAMSKIRIYDNDEILVKGNWLETLSNFRNYFTLIVSDLTSGNLSYESRFDFYTSITNALNRDGFFYDKVLTHNEYNIPFNNLVEKYSNLPLNLLSANYFSSEMLFCSELLDINQTVDTSLFYSIIYDRVANRRVRAIADEARSKITPEGGIWYYGRRWDELKEDYCPKLELLSERLETDHSNPYYGRLRFFIMQKT